MTLRQEILIGSIAITVLLVSLFGLIYTAKPSPAVSGPAKNATTTIPAFTKEIQAQLAASKGFQLLVSYTDNGFEPAEAKIEQGQTIRFTNNSSHDMWVAASTEMGSLYPGKGSCGQSSFDGCKGIGRSMFWEFTFDEIGTWGYHDNAEPTKTGRVVVE